MSRHLQRSALLCLFAVSVAACSNEAATPNAPDALPPVANGTQTAPVTGDARSRRVKRAHTSYVTIEGKVTSILTIPYYHVVANVSGKNVSIYTGELNAAKVGYIVKATGFFNSLGNFQAASASIVSTGSGSPAPSNSPSPAPTASPKPSTSPPAGPPSAPPGGTVSGVIKQFQVFDFNITAAQSTSNAPNMSVVWGAGTGDAGANPRTWLAGNAQLAVAQYVVQPTDYYPVSGHGIAWWQANHPDWVVYDCDQNNNPTHTVAYQPGLPQDVPLDIHNPSVVNYQVQTAAAFAIAHGANALGFDQTLFFDYDGGQQPGWFGCGVYSPSGSFIRRWGATKGGFPNYDPQWNHDVAAWMAGAKTILTTDAILAPHHLKLFVNHPAGSITDPDEQTVIANVDGDLDETGFTDYGHYAAVPNLFNSTLSYMEFVQGQGKQFLDIAKFSGNLTGASSNFGLSAAQVSYAIATFLMGDEGRASLFISPGPYGKILNFSQIAMVNSKIGTACGSYSTVANGNVYERKFSGGMVIVNPGAAGTVNVSLTHAYTNLMSDAGMGAGTVPVGPASSYILFTSSNGCL